MSDEHHDEHQAHHAVNYTAIFGVLCVCTVASIVLDLSKEHLTWAALAVLILAVAVCKATFVILYFMHIKFETAWKYVLLAPTMVLACALPFALAPDIAFHYYNVIVPQTVAEAEEHASTHGGTGHAPTGHAADARAAQHAEPGHKEADHKPEKAGAEHKPHAPAEKAHK